jgi:AcrR family transcriptional regulator
VNELTVFRHFGNKEGILEEIIKSKLPIMKRLANFGQQGAQYELIPDLIRIATIHYQVLNENKDLLNLILREIETNAMVKEYYAELPKGFKNVLVNYFNEMQNKGKIKSSDSEVLAVSFMSMNFGYILMKQRFHDHVTTLPSAKFIEHTVKIFAEGLLP